ncbi:MAG: leucine--tRNA ligase [Candidatus Thermoplasmatota archaeon]|nr:leucine--tRNA ligase [Candidatus Thermoplasmatota archaeon]
MALDFSAIEAKWRKAWYEAKVNESVPVPGKKKFFMIFAYPGVTGYLHVGHMRGYTFSDAVVRYKMMTGHQVLFPVGTHATGNGAITFARRVERGDPVAVDVLRANGVPEETIAKLKDPMEVVKFLNDVFINDYWKRFGFMSDWRRFTCTIYPDYSKFIEWQMRKLMSEGLLIQKPYFAPACLEHGPVAIDASETDISKGGNAEVLEYTVLKFDLEDGRKLVAATLRPETVFGLTNFWVNPEVEYVDAQVDGEIWVVSREAAEKLALQKDKVLVKGSADGASLMAKRCRAPYTGKMIPIFPSVLCDPNVGTGLVMSVPSDAPVDWIGLVELRKDTAQRERYGITDQMMDEAAPIPIIDTPGWGSLPAIEITERMGIDSLADPKLEEATKEIYKTGFHKGVMNEICGGFAGQPVERAKDAMRDEMLSSGQADLFYDLSEEVLCRCGGKVLVKKIPDQWFIDYASPTLTERAKEHALTMKILPREYYENMQAVLEWYRERACVRLGNWLGTRFPFDQKWIIEAIADSTLYPAYYIVSRYANEGLVRPDGMTEEFFDFVMLGKGNSEAVATSTGVPRETLDAIRSEFEYWHPLDINLGGKEHMTVHFPVFLMNHVAILRPEHWPRGIIVNWYITATGGKISKSKGGAQPIPDAAERFGVDAMRLFYAHIASLYVDVPWDDEKVEGYRDRLERLWSQVQELLEVRADEESGIDAWLAARMQTRLFTLHRYMDTYDLRSYVNDVYFEMPRDFKWYLRRYGKNKSVVSKALETWIALMAPVTPHIAEEMWQLSGREQFVSTYQIQPGSVDEHIIIEEAKERLIERLMADVAEIVKVTGLEPKRTVVMVAPKWKQEMLAMALSDPKGKPDVPALIKGAISTVESPAAKKEVPAYAKDVSTEVMKASAEDRQMLGALIDEMSVLSAAKGFLESELGCAVEIFAADDPGRADPKGKARLAKPGRPAIYLE